MKDKKFWEILKRAGRKHLCLITALIFLLSGCGALPSEEMHMDFNEKMELKVPEPVAGEYPKILFVGNSHTFYNDLPGTFYLVAEAMGHESDVYDLTAGNYKLENYADIQDELGDILDQVLTEETWDFVILQENTQSVMGNVEQAMYPHARILDEKIQKAGAQTVFLMTWTPKGGSGSISRENFQTVIAERYVSIAEELNSLLIPGGVAFMRCSEQHPEIELWDEDGYHPSLAGTYLAACTAYAIIFRESPIGCEYMAELDEEVALQLQEVAAGFLE